MVFASLYPKARSIVGGTPSSALATTLGQHILRIQRDKRNATRGRDERHYRREVLAFIPRLERDSDFRCVILNHGFQYRRRPGRTDVNFAGKILPPNLPNAPHSTHHQHRRARQPPTAQIV